MPNVKMPDGVVVAFPDDMPPEQIKSLILKKFPDAGQTPAGQTPADPMATTKSLTSSPNLSGVPVFGPMLAMAGYNGMPKIDDSYADPKAAYDSALAKVRHSQFPGMSDDAFAQYSSKALAPYGLTELSQHGALLGATDEMSAGIGALGSATKNLLGDQSSPDFGEAYLDYEALERARRDLGRQQQGLLGTGAEVLGGFASMGKAPAGGLPAAAQTGTRFLQGATNTMRAAVPGAAYGFGATDGDFEERLKGGGAGALMSAAASAAAPLVTRVASGIGSRAAQRGVVRQAVQAAPTAAAIKSGSRASFQAAKATGATIDQRAVGILHDEVRQILKDDNLLLGKGKVSREFPTTRHMLKALEEYAAGDVTMSQLITFKKSVARMMNSKSEAAVGHKVNELLDDFVDALPQSAWVAGDGQAATLHWAKGKVDWARGRRTETIEKALYNARFKGTGNFADSLRAQFGSILTNEKRRRGFDPADIAAIEKFVEGDPVNAVLQHLSHGNPYLAAIAGHVVGGPVVGAAAAVARPVVALGAGALRNQGARQAGRQIRAGVASPGQLVQPPLVPVPMTINGVARRVGVAAENRLGEDPRRVLVRAVGGRR